MQITSKVVTVNNDNQIVAIALLTRGDVARLGSSLKKVYRIDDTPRFGELIRALDEADNAVPVPDQPDGASGRLRSICP